MSEEVQDQTEQMFTQSFAYTCREAEEKILGLAMTLPEYFPRIRQFLQPTDFFSIAHKRIYTAMLELADDAILPEFLAVSDRLKVTNHLEGIGGRSYLCDLIVSTSDFNARYLEQTCQIIWEHSERRKANLLLTEYFDELKSGNKNAGAVSEEIITRFREVGQDRRSPAKAFSDLLTKATEELEKRFESKGVDRLRTHIGRVDDIMGGFEPGDFIVIGARPSMGKTLFGLNIAYNIAAAELNPKPVAFFSLEMSTDRIITRLVSRHSKINSRKFRSGNLDNAEFSAWYTAVGEMSALPLHLFDSKSKIKTFAQIEARIREMPIKPALIIIDYLLLINTGDQKLDANPVTKYTWLSGAFKSLAQELQIPIILLTQLNRDIKLRQDKRPIMSDLKDSSALEQDADVIAFVHRESYYNRKSKYKEYGEIIIAKNRDGEIGSAPVKYNPQIQRFSDVEDGFEFEEEEPTPEPAKGRYRKRGSTQAAHNNGED